MSDAFNAALTGIKTSKADLALNSHNIANANVEGYTRLALMKNSSIVGNKVAGVDVTGIMTYVDDNLQDRVYSRISIHEYNKVITDSIDKVHSEFGTPNSAGSLDASVNKMFMTLEQLSSAPNSASLKYTAVQDMQNTVNKISGLSHKIEKMRFEVDNQIKASIDQMNVTLEKAFNINVAKNTYVEGSLERVNAEDKMRNIYEELSSYLNISKFVDSNGKTKVFTNDGTSLVGDSQYFLKYTPMTSETSIVNEEPFNAIKLSYYTPSGQDTYFDREIVSSGKSSEVTHTLGGGKLSGLIALRDKELPKMLEQLDRLAKNLSDQMNKVHNQGSGFNPPSELKGHTLISRDQLLGFSGNVRVGVVDRDGKAISNIPSLTIDLGTLDSGQGAGKANVESFLQEIDYHFGARLSTDKSVSVGNLKDIKLSSVSQNLVAGSPLELDFELSNFSQTAATISVLNVSATDSLTNNILGSFNGATHNILNGKIERTTIAGPSIVINNPASLNYPYTIDVDIRVNDGTADFDATLTYTINNPSENQINGLRNSKFSVSTATGAATVSSAPLATGIMKTSLINPEGFDVAANSNELGILKISTLSNDHKIVIDSLDSVHSGVAGSPMLPSMEKLSYFLGLNDLFERSDDPKNWGQTKNSAYYLKIRDDVLENPNSLSTGNFRQKIDNLDPNNILYEYELSEGDVESLNKMIDLGKQKIFFNSAGGLTSTTVTLNEYAAEILGYNTTLLRRYESITTETGIIRNALQDKIQNIKGVDINEELANMIIYQQSFTASAKMISAVKEMNEILMNLI